MSSVLAMALVAGMAVLGDVPGMVSAEMEQGLDLSGEWKGAWRNGGTADNGHVYLSGTRMDLTTADALVSFEHQMADEGQGRLRFRGRLGIYRQDSDQLTICFRNDMRGRPVSFRAGDGQHLLILRRVRPRK